MAKAQPGSIDWSFQTDFDFSESDHVAFLGLQPNGKIVSKGTFMFSFLDGSKIENILQLEKDGRLDFSFKAGRETGKSIEIVTILPDGKILIREVISTSKYCERINLLNADGSIDSSFLSACLPITNRSFSVQQDGKIIIARSSLNQNNLFFVRLNKNGNADTSFKTKSSSFDNFIETIEILNDEKIIVTGRFQKVNNINHNQIARLNFNGILDTIFNPSAQFQSIYFISKIIEQPDKKLLVSGVFYLKNNSIATPIVRIDSNGILDTTFKLERRFNGLVKSMYLQKDGKILIGGNFTDLNGVGNGNIIRLHSDGKIDSSFVTGGGFDGGVSVIIPSGKNKILVGGSFSNYDSHLFSRIIRLNLEWEDSNLVIDTNFQFSIFPNPTSSHFRITSPKFINLITITDAIGKEILRIEPMAFDTEINIRDASPGVYFVTVFSDGASKCQKILKQ